MNSLDPPILPPAAPLELAKWFSVTIEGMVRTFGEGMDISRMPLVALVWLSLRRRSARFAVLVARFRAGTLSLPKPRTGKRVARPASARADALQLPRGKAWLVRLVGKTTLYYWRLLPLLADPEMIALLEASPQARRLLRPLWRMVTDGALPPILQLPKRPRKPRRAATPPADAAPKAETVSRRERPQAGQADAFGDTRSSNELMRQWRRPARCWTFPDRRGSKKPT